VIGNTIGTLQCVFRYGGGEGGRCIGEEGYISLVHDVVQYYAAQTLARQDGNRMTM
jgi:hypothetical protein